MLVIRVVGSAVLGGCFAKVVEAVLGEVGEDPIDVELKPLAVELEIWDIDVAPLGVGDGCLGFNLEVWVAEVRRLDVNEEL